MNLEDHVRHIVREELKEQAGRQELGSTTPPEDDPEEQRSENKAASILSGVVLALGYEVDGMEPSELPDAVGEIRKQAEAYRQVMKAYEGYDIPANADYLARRMKEMKGKLAALQRERANNEDG